MSLKEGVQGQDKTTSQLNAEDPTIPVVTVSPTFCRELPHLDSFQNLRQSPSNLSLDRGLTASPIPWRDASMEVLVSPNDGPQISIEDYDTASLEDSPFYSSELSANFDTISMCETNSGRSQGRINSESSFSTPLNGVDKLLDRKFACYGVSPRLPRKTNDSSNFIPVSKGSRPMTLSFNQTQNLRPMSGASITGLTEASAK